MASESDYLSASEIEAIDERARLWKARGIEQTGSVADDRAALLRHLDALTAPADGEALGRIGWDVYRKEHAYLGQGWIAWEDMDDDSRAAFIAPALHLHAIGHAAGALSREGEIAELRAVEVNLRDSCRIFTINIEEREERIADLEATITRAADAAIEDAEKARRFGYHERDAEVATARADGARDEREAITKGFV